jgi:hypothetical protein
MLIYWTSDLLSVQPKVVYSQTRGFGWKAAKAYVRNTHSKSHSLSKPRVSATNLDLVDPGEKQVGL